jgi:hypothetical protein
MAGCWGSSCSPISISEELPREITKEAKVTGIPLPDSSPAAALADVSFDVAAVEDGAGLARSGPTLLPRRSRMMNPSSCSAATKASTSI